MCLNLPKTIHPTIPSVEKLSFTKPVPGAKKVGDRCCRSFMIFSLTFRSLIHFEFIIGYGERKCSNLIVLHVAASFPSTLQDCFFSIVYPCHLFS